VLLAVSESPLYAAVTESDPAGRFVLVNVAIPFALRVAEPREVAPFLKVTLPVADRLNSAPERNPIGRRSNVAARCVQRRAGGRVGGERAGGRADGRREASGRGVRAVGVLNS